MINEEFTPISAFLRDYRDRNPLRLHMPGHKGKGTVEALDLTEVHGLPNLYPAAGIVRDSEEIAARLFGAGRTVYSTEGSSLCVRAMMALISMRAEARGRRPAVLAGRNAHRSFLTAAALLGIEVTWLRGSDLLTCRPTAEELAAALRSLPVPPEAVYLTSPDYPGNLADIRALAAVCHEHHIALLVDNAHGAYLRFGRKDLHPLSLGADMTCDSAHKTLPVLTGGAYLHIHQKADPFFSAQAERAMALFASTSPSWLILESLDRCNAYLASGYRKSLAAFEDAVSGLKLRLSEHGFELIGDEPLKITLSPRKTGYTGNELHDLLRRENMECEFSDPDLLVMMVTPETGAEGLDRLEKALTGLPKREPLPCCRPSLPLPCPVLPLSKALTAPAEEVPAEKSLDRVLADPSVSCPPAVPILLSGERITPEAVQCFHYYGVETVSCVME